MNRQMRNRTSGDVGGRREQSRLLPDFATRQGPCGLPTVCAVSYDAVRQAKSDKNCRFVFIRIPNR